MLQAVGNREVNSEHLSQFIPFVISHPSQTSLFDLLDCGLAGGHHKVVLDLAHSGATYWARIQNMTEKGH